MLLALKNISHNLKPWSWMCLYHTSPSPKLLLDWETVWTLSREVSSTRCSITWRDSIYNFPSIWTLAVSLSSHWCLSPALMNYVREERLRSRLSSQTLLGSIHTATFYNSLSPHRHFGSVSVSFPVLSNTRKNAFHITSHVHWSCVCQCT